MIDNLDVDQPGIILDVEWTVGVVTENGGSTTFFVDLNSKPKRDVEVRFLSSRPTEGRVEPASLIFTADTYHQPHKITVVGQPDDVKDGDQGFVVSVDVVTNDPDYARLSTNDLRMRLINIDRTNAAVVVGKPTQLNFTSLVTNENSKAPDHTDIIHRPQTLQAQI